MFQNNFKKHFLSSWRICWKQMRSSIYLYLVISKSVLKRTEKLCKIDKLVYLSFNSNIA